MAAKFGYLPEGLEYCRTSRPLPPTTSRPGEPARTYPIGSRINQQAVAADLDSDKEKARRRIAVACSRCRKRKIKCTGDLGNGQGCLNCKNAGTDPQLCQFLRVSSVNTGYGLVTAPAEYPYPLMGLSNAPTVNPGSLGGINTYAAANPIAPVTGPTRLSRYSVTGTPYSFPLPSSPDQYYGYNGSDSHFESYNYHQPHQIHGILGHEAPIPVGIYSGTSGQEQLREWIPGVPQSGRTVSNGYEEKLHGGSSSSLPFAGLASTTTHETQPLFPAMSALASNLPASASDDRVLPTPTQNSIPSISSEVSGQGYNTDGPVSIKSDYSWAERSGSVSLPTTSGPATNASGRSSMAYPEDQKPLFPYNHFRNINDAQSSESSAAPEYAFAAATPTTSTVDEEITPASAFSSGSYTYSMPSSKRPSLSEGMLLSGQRYTPLPHRPLPAHYPYHHHRQTLGLHSKEYNETKNTSRTPLATVAASHP